ncbi:uncharacterized protein ARMOST_02428 [Armillaria ostoyae]|uniref:F-box domain-containing protein n=1 Tax=Armillaria ostoyae TaxID=47428 RepID=A0A284QRW9_ARMOS|nr:uncharacterized protein ARMOST_02428 [Armillaria ostoyae]
MKASCPECGLSEPSADYEDLTSLLRSGASHEDVDSVTLHHEAVHLEKELTVLTSLLDETHRKHAKVKLALDSRNSLIRAHIRRLPRELLLEVFHHLQNESDSGLDSMRAPWIFAHICSFWRDTCLSSPSLFATISIDNECSIYPVTHLVSEALRLAKNHPLTIKIHRRFRVNTNFENLFDHLALSSEYWSHVDIKVVEGYNLLRLLQGPRPLSLRHMSLEVTSTFLRTDGLSSSPLEYISHNGLLCDVPTTLRHLRYLSIRIMDSEEFWDVVDAAASLETFIVLNDHFREETPTSRDAEHRQVLFRPRLRYLEFRQSWIPFTLGSVAFPSLEEFWTVSKPIGEQGNSTRGLDMITEVGVQRIVDLVHRSQCSLRSFTLNSPILIPKHGPILHSSLSTLEVTFNDKSSEAAFFTLMTDTINIVPNLRCLTIHDRIIRQLGNGMVHLCLLEDGFEAMVLSRRAGSTSCLQQLKVEVHQRFTNLSPLSLYITGCREAYTVWQCKKDGIDAQLIYGGFDVMCKLVRLQAS